MAEPVMLQRVEAGRVIGRHCLGLKAETVTVCHSLDDESSEGPTLVGDVGAFRFAAFGKYLSMEESIRDRSFIHSTHFRVKDDNTLDTSLSLIYEDLSQEYRDLKYTGYLDVESFPASTLLPTLSSLFHALVGRRIWTDFQALSCRDKVLASDEVKYAN